MLYYSPDGCCEVLADLVLHCTRIESEERPTFTEILKYIEQFTTAWNLELIMILFMYLVIVPLPIQANIMKDV